ncbi:MAG TPA: DMT family transporter [Candidatus Acidoferrum sp.]|nr:DMT family transporter [Candidatus Acidoferrum sp.]
MTDRADASATGNATGADHSGRSLAYLALLGGILCIGWSAIFVRWTEIPGPASAFYRLLIPALVLAPTWWLDRKTASVDRRTLFIICAGGVFFALDLAFYNTSILKTSAANATLLGNNTPIFIGLISWLALRRRPSAEFWLGLALAVAGSLVIVWGDLARHAHLGWGDAMALLASACFAVYLLATEEVRGHTGTLVFLRLAIVSSAIFLLALNLAMRVPLSIPSSRSFAALIGLGLISQLGGYFALTYAMGHLPATVTSVSLLSQGPLTAVLAAVFLKEPMTRPLLLGGALVLVGIALANRLKRPEQEANAALCEAAEAGEGETPG